MIFKIATAPIVGFDFDKDTTNTVASWRTENTGVNVVDDSPWEFNKREGMMYVAVRAVSVGTNGNGDTFTEDELRRSYKTFVGKGVFVNHASNDVEKKRGVIIDAKWVEAAPAEKYVICLLEMNEAAHPDFCRMIRAKQIDAVSMGAVYDIGLPHLVTLEDLSVKSYFDVQVGDRVITHDGTVSEVVVKGKEWHENRIAYTIKAMKANPVVISEEHPLLVLRKSDKSTQAQERFVAAKDICVGDYVLSNIYSIVQPTTISMSEARFLGWYLAEGSLCDKTGIELTLNIEDPIENIKTLVWECDASATIKQYPHSSSNAALKLMIYSKSLRELVERTISGNAKTKSLSREIMEMEPLKQLALVGTYIDGDGCLASNKSTKNAAISISTSSPKLATQIPTILERSGVLPSVHALWRKPGKNSVVKRPFLQHTLFIGGSYVQPLRTHSQKVAKVALTKASCKRSFVYGNYVAVPITSITKTQYTGWAYNIQVSSDENPLYKGNHSYHLNGLASHNCQVAYSLCSICKHSAKTTKDYCMHVKFHKGGAYDGRPVTEINQGIEFIEVSWVTVGADPQAKMIEVIARQRGLDFQGLLQQAAAGQPILEQLESQGIEQTIMAGIRRANQQKKKEQK